MQAGSIEDAFARAQRHRSRQRGQGAKLELADADERWLLVMGEAKALGGSMPLATAGEAVALLGESPAR